MIASLQKSFNFPNNLLIPFQRQSELILISVEDRDDIDFFFTVISLDYYLISFFN